MKIKFELGFKEKKKNISRLSHDMTSCVADDSSTMQHLDLPHVAAFIPAENFTVTISIYPLKSQINDQ